jgi:hypothetical protein
MNLNEFMCSYDVKITLIAINSFKQKNNSPGLYFLPNKCRRIFILNFQL